MDSSLPVTIEVRVDDGPVAELSLDEPTDRPCIMDLVPGVTFVAAARVFADASFTLTGYEDKNGDPVVLRAMAVR